MTSENAPERDQLKYEMAIQRAADAEDARDEALAMVGALQEYLADFIERHAHPDHAVVVYTIRGLKPDAIAALERVKAEARAEGMREAAMMVLAEGMKARKYPEEAIAETYCEDAAAAILAAIDNGKG